MRGPWILAVSNPVFLTAALLGLSRRKNIILCRMLSYYNTTHDIFAEEYKIVHWATSIFHIYANPSRFLTSILLINTCPSAASTITTTEERHYQRPITSVLDKPVLVPSVLDWRSRPMSGFLSREAEAALSAQEAQAHRNYYQTTAHDPRLAERAGRSPYQQQWTTALHPAMTSAQSQSSPQVFSTPAQYGSGLSLNPNAFARGQYAPLVPHVVPSSPYSSEQHWPNAPWPTLRPDDVDASSDSRSASPNPADLHNFGFPLPDGRSWRCAYPNCNSQARFTRGCDLRKHYRRHTKSLFCRHEECPQSREGGFSSRKDRDRHESKVLPTHWCRIMYFAD